MSVQWRTTAERPNYYLTFDTALSTCTNVAKQICWPTGVIPELHQSQARTEILPWHNLAPGCRWDTRRRRL